MIGKLKGVVDDIGEDHLIVDVHGVGYVVFTAMKTLSSLPSVGEAVVLHVETHVREDAIKLFGFTSPLEQQWFRILQNVQGVGAKVALALLSTLTLGELSNAIALRDVAMVSRAPGIGKRVAERIITELKGKTPTTLSTNENHDSHHAVDGDNSSQAVSDAISALVNLGYSREQSAKAIGSALENAEDSKESAQLIRLGLKKLSR